MFLIGILAERFAWLQNIASALSYDGALYNALEFGLNYILYLLLYGYCV